MKEIYETTYQGMKITIDKKMTYITLGLVMIGVFCMLYREFYAALVIFLLAALPFLHEAGHYLMARRHNFTVTSITFEDDKLEMKCPDLMTHKDIFEISVMGEIVNGIVYLLASGLIYQWGRVTGSPFIVLFLIVPGIWLMTWMSPQSDFRVALTAWQYHKAQMGID